MATLIIDNTTYTINDGNSITKACQEAGVPFNCNTGICASCIINILEGEENLSPLTHEEIDLYLNSKTRLACKCRIISGTVKATF